MAIFHVKRTEASLEARYNKPAFALLGAPSNNLHGKLFDALYQYGVRPEDVTIDRGHAQLSNLNVTYALNRIDSGFRIFIDKTEIVLSISKLTSEDAAYILSSTLSAIQNCGEIEYAHYAATVGMHGEVENRQPTDYLENWINAPQSDVELVGAGVVFNYGQIRDMQSLSILMEPSGVYANSIFIRCVMNYSAENIKIDQIEPYVRERTEESLRTVGLEIPDNT